MYYIYNYIHHSIQVRMTNNIKPRPWCFTIWSWPLSSKNYNWTRWIQQTSENNPILLLSPDHITGLSTLNIYCIPFL